MKIKAAVFDIDGTLVPYGAPGPGQAAVQALRELAQSGVAVVIATGRARYTAQWVLGSGIKPDYFAAVNGADVTDAAGRPVWQSRMTPEEMYALVDFCEDHELPLEFIFSDAYYVYVEYAAFVEKYCGQNAASGFFDSVLRDGEDQVRHLQDMPFGACAAMDARHAAAFEAKSPHCPYKSWFYHISSAQHFFSDDIHVGYTADCQLLGQTIEIQAGAAGQDLHTFCLQCLQILQHRRSFTGQTGSAVIEKNGFRQVVLLGQGKCKCLQKRLSKFLTALAHLIIGNHNHGIGTAVRNTGFASGSCLRFFLFCLFTHRKDNLIFLIRQLLCTALIALLLCHFRQILNCNLIIHQHFHLTGTLQFRDRLFGFYNGQWACVTTGINFQHHNCRPPSVFYSDFLFGFGYDLTHDLCGQASGLQLCFQRTCFFWQHSQQ